MILPLMVVPWGAAGAAASAAAAGGVAAGAAAGVGSDFLQPATAAAISRTAERRRIGETSMYAKSRGGGPVGGCVA